MKKINNCFNFLKKFNPLGLEKNLYIVREWPEMMSFSKGVVVGWEHDDVTFFPFLEVSKKYKSDQNYVYNFSFVSNS
jgi:hypothetical protein